jgi:hypothetical protein
LARLNVRIEILMGYDKLLPMMLIPVMLLGQDAISDAARVLLSKSQVGPIHFHLYNEGGRIARTI